MASKQTSRRTEEFTTFTRALAADACHEGGMTLMNAAFPIARTVVGIPVAGAAFVTGWALLFASRSLTSTPDLFARDFADGEDDEVLMLG